MLELIGFYGAQIVLLASESHSSFTGYASAESTSSAASLPQAALRLTAALIGAHGKDVGASGGLEVIREMAPSWGPLLQQAPCHRGEGVSKSDPPLQ